MAREHSIEVEKTGIKVRGKDLKLLKLVAQLTAPNDESDGLTVPAANSLAQKLQAQELNLKQVKFVQEKKGFQHPLEAANWLLEANNKLILYLWEQDLKGGPVKEHVG